ncbi:hypothetical protein RhiirA5_435614 [Rhizophagus irregularis]|uniref:Uncharacterized protein n=1 Tax=Rhizophagus irregularis TaxID=588596 RepID=A0A2N0NN62_9GLOM|nr:hypothetical protein RhiirA5_435614 [Rhizophagus irregularis]
MRNIHQTCQENSTLYRNVSNLKHLRETETEIKINGLILANQQLSKESMLDEAKQNDQIKRNHFKKSRSGFMDKLIFDRCNNANQFSFNTTNSREIYYYPNAKNSFSNLNILSISFENKMLYDR